MGRWKRWPMRSARVGAGLVCEHWGVAEMLSLMQQLGAVPADPPA